MPETCIHLDGGKYTVIHNNGTELRALRDGEPWRDLAGDRLVLAMAQELEDLRVRLDEVHSWIVCAVISTPADMMQNAEHICAITAPKENQNG
ncbi:hypothetical protein [Acidovorax phage ACPWH]|nr:hypothetical protein [Acidovorax phage ACPWH]